MSVTEKIELQDPTLLRDNLFIAGEWTPSSDDRRTAVTNPATGQVIAEVSMATAEDVQQAIVFADTAFKSWAQMTAVARAKIMRNWFQLTLDNVEDLARILTSEQGKPLAEARAEIIYGGDSRYHSMEFSHGHDCTQSRSRFSRWMPHDYQTGYGYSSVRSGDGCSC